MSFQNTMTSFLDLELEQANDLDKPQTMHKTL